MIKWGFILLGLLFFRAQAQDVSVLMKKAADAEAAFREEEALGLFQQVLRSEPRNSFILCRCSDLSCRVGNRMTDRDRKVSFFQSGYRYASTAYTLDSTNSEANVMMAFSLGRLTLIQTNKERVEAAVAIKRYAGQAIRYDPANFKAYHILGRWHYEVSKLNFIERTFARWFFGALPDASLADAIWNYEKSMSLRPDFMLNYLELAKALHRDGQDNRAIALLHQLAGLHDEMYDDRTVRAEGATLLEELTR